MITKLRGCLWVLLMLNIINVLLAQGSWTPKTNFGGSGRKYSTYFAVDGMGYVGFGYDNNNNMINDLWQYDPVSNSWTQEASIPGQSGRSEMQGFAIGNYGYVGLGLSTTGSDDNGFWKFDPSTNTWDTIASWPDTWVRLPFSFVIGTNAYVGSGAASGVMNEFWEYNSITNTWTQKNNIPSAAVRYGGVGFAIGDKGYGAIGVGIDGSSAKDDLWQYDTATDNWTQIANFGGGIRVNGCGFASTSKGYIGCGHNNLGTYYYDFWEYDPVTNIWSQKVNYPGVGTVAGAGFAIGCHEYMGLGCTPAPNFITQNDLWQFTSDSLPVLAISPSDTTICSGNSVELTASLGNSYIWSPAAYLNTSSGPSVIAMPQNNITYTVTDTSSASCGASASVTVDVSSGISASISDDTSICSGQSVTLNATGGATYSWTPAAGLNDTTGASVNATPDSSTTYTVTVSAAGCSVIANVLITINSNVVASVSIDTTAPGPYCFNTPVNFTAQALNGGTPTYQWLVNGNNAGTNSATFTSDTLSNNDVVNCIMTSTAACVSGSPATSNSIGVTIIPQPVAGNITANKDSLCAGSSITLTDTGSSGNLQWQSSTDGVSFTNITGATSSTYDTSSLNQTTYYLVTSSATCGVDTSAFFKIFISPLPVPVLAAQDTIFCPGDSTQICENNPYTTYYWTTGNTTSCIYVSEPNDYRVTVSNAYGCSAVSEKLSISTYALPPVFITAHGDTLSTVNAVSSQWLLNDTAITGATSSTYIARRSGYYTVVVTDSNGCTTPSSPTHVIINSVENLSSGVFEIYPNPAANILMIHAVNMEPQGIFIYDVSGQLVLQQKFTPQLDISTLQPGTYFIEVKGTTSTARKQFLKM